MKSLNKSYFDKYVDPIVREIDRVNVYEFENGMDYELLQLGGNIDPENIKKAQTKVLKNLKKDPAFYTNQLAADSVKLVGEFGSGKKAGKYSTPKDAEAVKAEVKTSKDDTVKIDKENEMKIAKKDATSNVSKDKKTKLAPKTKEMTQTPKKAKGIKSVMDMPGKEKIIKVNLKEGVDVYTMNPASYLAALDNNSHYVKAIKQELVNDLAKKNIVKNILKKYAEMRLDDADVQSKVKFAMQDLDNMSPRQDMSMESLSEAKDDIDSVWASHKETFLKSLKESQGKAFKLTKENMGMIKSMIKEMVTATMVARTDKPTIDKLKQEKKPFELY
jgi:hypothetical protein